MKEIKAEITMPGLFGGIGMTKEFDLNSVNLKWKDERNQPQEQTLGSFLTNLTSRMAYVERTTDTLKSNKVRGKN